MIYCGNCPYYIFTFAANNFILEGATCKKSLFLSLIPASHTLGVEDESTAIPSLMIPVLKSDSRCVPSCSPTLPEVIATGDKIKHTLWISLSLNIAGDDKTR